MTPDHSKKKLLEAVEEQRELERYWFEPGRTWVKKTELGGVDYFVLRVLADKELQVDFDTFFERFPDQVTIAKTEHHWGKDPKLWVNIGSRQESWSLVLFRMVYEPHRPSIWDRLTDGPPSRQVR